MLLFVGNLTEQKRPDRFLRTILRLRQGGLPVEGWLVGDGPLRDEMQRMADDLGIADTVHFMGYRQDADVYMSAADLLLVTSDSDGIPAVVLEAGYLRTPTVATRVGGMHECIEDGKTGILVDVEDEEGLVEGAGWLMGAEAQRWRMGDSALEWMTDRFAMEAVAVQYLEFYEPLLQARAQ